jgi:DNA-binding NtrC family response regulator
MANILETKSKVLIVQEEGPTCHLLQEMLIVRGFRCTVTHDARKMSEILKESDFDAALLDFRMPGINSFELLAQVTSGCPSVSVIVLGAVNELRAAVETMKAGAADYIPEPFDLRQVEDAVRSAIERKNLRKNGSTPEISDVTFSGIEAIAIGVEARQEILDVHSEIIVQQTIEIARQMGFPEEKIQSWVVERTEKRSQRIKQLTESICKIVPAFSVPNLLNK